ncbi:MAG: hypothetical protein GY942_03640 [Aestuariibacter sp.]|nr:hypothetical protein [Aestuariibacter sp.]
MSHTLEIGGLYFGDIEANHIIQTYGVVDGGFSTRRMADGSLHPQCFWDDKITTTISGDGVLPPGMDSLTRRTDYTLKCVAHRTLSSTLYTMAASLPGKRSDVAVIYSAWTNGVLTPWDGATDISADTYRATYVPEFTARLVSKSVPNKHHSREWEWTLTFEEK